MAALIQDEFGKVTLRFYHIYKNLTDKIKPGNRLRIFGEVRVGARGLELYHPEIQLINEHTPLPKTQLTAIYPSTDGLTQAKLREYVKQALKHHSDAFTRSYSLNNIQMGMHSKKLYITFMSRQLMPI